jgi:hypothetical protein
LKITLHLSNAGASPSALEISTGSAAVWVFAYSLILDSNSSKWFKSIDHISIFFHLYKISVWALNSGLLSIPQYPSLMNTTVGGLISSVVVSLGRANSG